MTDTRTSDQIEREIDAERSALARAMNDLQDSFSSEHIVANLSDSLRSVSGDLATSISETVRRNPVPSALIGFGLAWLAASAARSSDATGQNLRGRYDATDAPWSGLEESDNFDARVAAADRNMRQGEYGGGDSEDGFVSGLRDTASEYGAQAQKKIDDLVERITAGTEEMSEAARRRVIAAREAAVTAHLKVQNSVSHAAHTASETAKSQPLAVGGVALVGGAILGAALPGTERENRAFGAYRDRLFDEAERVYREERAKLEAASRAALDETRTVLKETMSEAANSPSAKAS